MRINYVFCLLTLLAATSSFAESGRTKLVLKPAGDSYSRQTESSDETVNIDFPEKTDVRDIARAVSLWTGREYKVDESVKMKVTLHSPERVSKDEAVNRFLRMLEAYKLKVVEDRDGFRISLNETDQK